MAEKLGRDSASSSNNNTTTDRNISRRTLKSADKLIKILSRQNLKRARLTFRDTEFLLQELVGRVHEHGVGGDEVDQQEDLHPHLEAALAQRAHDTAVIPGQRAQLEVAGGRHGEVDRD